MSAVLKHLARTPCEAFELRRTANGNWIVEGPGNRCGGIFIDEAAARRFIRKEERAAAAGRLPRTSVCLFRTTPTLRRRLP